MEKRLIDANALIAEYDRVHIGPAGGARKLIEDAPTVDAVEVIRCGECRHWVHEFGIVGHCNYAGIHLDHANYGFCSCGERRSDGEES